MAPIPISIPMAVRVVLVFWRIMLRKAKSSIIILSVQVFIDVLYALSVF